MTRFEETIDMKFIQIILIATLLLSGCYEYPSTKEIDADILVLEKDIESAKANSEKYDGGLLAILANIQIETLAVTKAMLEQKRKGIYRYIPIKYTVEGREYSPPANKKTTLEELNKDIDDVKAELLRAEVESELYEGRLLRMLSLAQVAIERNTLASLNQRRLLLKYDIPYFNNAPSASSDSDTEFKPTPGEDISKF